MMATEKQIKIIKRTERHERQATPTEKSRAHTRNSDDVAKRDAVIKVMVQEFPLVRATDAHRAIENRKTTGKVVLRVQ